MPPDPARRDVLSDQDGCAVHDFPQVAIDAMVAAAAKPAHDDGHTDCYYAGLLVAAWPHVNDALMRLRAENEALKAERDHAVETRENANAATLRAEHERDGLRGEVERLRAIMDRPDPRDFLAATEIEARFQLDKWGDERGRPTAFGGSSDADFERLIHHLCTKALYTTPDEGVEKKLHRITTVAAAACNWHMTELARTSDEGKAT